MAELLCEHPKFSHLDCRTMLLKLKKPAYGLVDAPRAWFTELSNTLKSFGWESSMADPAFLFKRRGGIPLGFMTLHVDDLKISAPDQELILLEQQLSTRFGTLKRQEGTFEHTGIIHECSDAGVRMHQKHYLEKLVPLTQEQMAVCKRKSNQVCSHELHQVYRSLLGRVAWTVSTRPEAAVLAGMFQTKANNPTHEDLLRLNVTAKWLKTHPSEIFYPHMTGPFQLVLVSDAAFKGEDETRQARRGEVLLLCPRKRSLGGVVHVLDYASKKIGRVTKSTYSAELHSLCSGADHAVMVSMLFEQLFRHDWNLSLRDFERHASDNELHVPVSVVVDAWSVFQSLTQTDPKLPEEQPLILLVLHIREFVKRGLISEVFWCATSDMLADGLTKSTVSRD
eukprot:2821821-Amphidinium_carterae.1